MSEALSLSNPSRLLLRRQDGDAVWGANQIWYPTEFKRRAGCGPTVGSHLAWYLAQQAGLEALCPQDCSVQDGMLALMEEMWFYITPGRRGVNSTELFTGGLTRYARDRGVALCCDVLEVPPLHCIRRPSAQALLAFAGAALRRDLPLAFLNLSNGALHNLDNWHWVTLVGVNPQTGAATMVDQCGRREINLDLWLRTTLFGGGLVAARPA
ncbi:MAG: hypothetical protein GXX99_07495 [Clostridiales bacterium]|nr:hypothetical protein [Clostridiales bacterium]